MSFARAVDQEMVYDEQPKTQTNRSWFIFVNKRKCGEMNSPNMNSAFNDSRCVLFNTHSEDYRCVSSACFWQLATTGYIGGYGSRVIHLEVVLGWSFWVHTQRAMQCDTTLRVTKRLQTRLHAVANLNTLSSFIKSSCNCELSALNFSWDSTLSLSWRELQAMLAGSDLFVLADCGKS